MTPSLPQDSFIWRDLAAELRIEAADEAATLVGEAGRADAPDGGGNSGPIRYTSEGPNR